MNDDSGPQCFARESGTPWPDCTQNHVKRIFRQLSDKNLSKILLNLLADDQSSTSTGIIENIQRKLDCGELFSAHDTAVDTWFETAKQKPNWDVLVEVLNQCDENYIAIQISNKDESLFKDQSHSSDNSSKVLSVEDTIKNLQAEFRAILSEFQQFIESNRRDCYYFCEFLRGPLGMLIMEKKFYDEKNLDERNIKEIFKQMTNHAWNFIDFEVLNDLITTYIAQYTGPEELKDKLKCYEQKVKNLCEDITVNDLVRYWKPKFLVDIPDSFKSCIAKTPWDPMKCKVQELHILKRRFVAQVPQGIGMAAYVLVNLQNKSVKATWLVFTDEWEQLLNGLKHLIQESPKFIEEIQLSFFAIDDTILHPCTDQEQLWNACREGETRAVERLLKDARTDPNYTYEIFQRTALQCVAKHGDEPHAELLLNYGANRNYRDMVGFTAVMIAVRTGRQAMTEYLLSNGADVDIPDKARGMSPLLTAVERNDIPLFKVCKKYHANLNARNTEDKTALMLAAENGCEELVALLVCEGEDVIEVEAQDVHGQTALHIAVKYGHIKIAEELLQYPAAVFIKDENHDTPLNIAEKTKQREMIELIKSFYDESDLLHGEESSTSISSEMLSYDVELKEKESQHMDTTKDIGVIPLKEGDTSELASTEPVIRIPAALEESVDETSKPTEKVLAKPPPAMTEELTMPTAAEQKQDSSIRRFGRALFQTVRHGGTLNIRLVRAAKQGDSQVTEKMLKKGADPNARGLDTQRWTALIWATNNNHLEVVKVLLKYGADPNLTALLSGYTAFIIASWSGYHEILECLLDPNNPIKADIEKMNSGHSHSPMMWAAQTRGREAKSEEGKENRRKVVELLIKAGADVNKAASDGWTPLMQASQDNHLELVQMLCQVEGINLDQEENNTWTAITIACRKGKQNQDVIKELTKAGADFNKRKKGGVTALHIACFNNLAEAVECMLTGEKKYRRAVDIDAQDDWGFTPLMYSIKQDHMKPAKDLIKAGADVNIRAMKYAQWTAVYFAISTGNQELYDILVDHGADLQITDENNISPIAFSKGLFQEKQLYKYIIKKQQEQLQRQEQTQGEVKIETPPGKAYGAFDFGKYTFTDALWFARQRIYMTLNV